jgi:branched-chain amino acid transport system substrate-binding protein
VVPVADQCEALGVPCISTMAPWESYFLNRGGSTTKPFTWTYHFFAGLADYYNAYASMWNQQEVKHNRNVGVLLPYDLDGNVFASTNQPFLANLQSNFTSTLVQYTPGPTEKFTDTVSQLQANKVQIVTGIMATTDLDAFLLASNAAGYAPAMATISKAIMFPDLVQPMGEQGLTTEMFWSDKHPYVSFVTNQKASDLAAGFTAATGAGWSQQLGASMALFDVAAQALQRVDSITDKAGIAAALKGLTANTMLGKITFGGKEGVPANVATVKLNGGQWLFDQKAFAYDLVLVNDAGDTSIPTRGTLQALSGATS